MQSSRLLRRHLAGAVVLFAMSLAAVPAAQAGPLVAAAADCPEAEPEHPFLRWADPATYVLVPNGIAETGRSWDLKGGAQRRGGNETFFVHGAGESYSLSLPAGSSATSAPICAGLEEPTLRFFARNEGFLGSPLLVEVLYEDAIGAVHSLSIGRLLGGPRWQPTPILPVLANLLPLLPGDKTPLSFRFTAAPGGEWAIDDVYLDPWRHR
jgi:hypothetical protein